jgi:tRNA A-37 threonylcarbamoyl transferase component Bud32
MRTQSVYRGVNLRRRKLLERTLTELRAIAALAMAGLSRMPKAG